MNRYCKGMVLFCCGLMSIIYAAGAAQASEDDEWEFYITPYLWTVDMDVDSTVSGQTTNVDLSFSDILDTFDVLDFSFLSEAKKGWCMFILNFAGLNLETAQRMRNVNIDVDIEDVIVELMAGYRVFEHHFKKEEAPPFLSRFVWRRAVSLSETGNRS